MTHNRQFNYIIFHRGCLDGFSGFFVCYTSGRLTDNVQIYSDVPSSKRVPPNIDGKDVIIVDVAYKKEILERGGNVSNIVEEEKKQHVVRDVGYFKSLSIDAQNVLLQQYDTTKSETLQISTKSWAKGIYNVILNNNGNISNKKIMIY